MDERFFSIEVRAEDSDRADLACAEAIAAGASGAEELSRGDSGVGTAILRLYVPEARREAVLAALRLLPGTRLGEAVAVPPVDWVARSRARTEPVRIGTRLLVRPSWSEERPAPGAVEVVIDPGQAFGTGGHASTRLALELLAGTALEGRDVLDAGCGSGVLALAALRLGARRAVGFDLDPLATEASAENAARNGLRARLALFCGGVEALGARPFDVVVANLLRRELEPILPALCGLVAEGGVLVLSGLLAPERDRIEECARAHGLGRAAEVSEADPPGPDWLGLLMRPQGSPASS